MKVCTDCGAQQRNDAKFCSNCGKVFQDSVAQQNNDLRSNRNNTPPCNDTLNEPILELTEAEKEANQKELEASYIRDIVNIWKSDKGVLAWYNIIKVFFIFICSFSGINFFFADHPFWGIVAMIGMQFLRN